MFRRGLSIALILGYAATQMALIPHAHPGDPLHLRQPSPPHVHLTWFGGDEHDHHHAHHQHSDDHSTGSGQTAPPSGIRVVQSAGHDHDADAIYLPTSVAARQSTDARHARLVNDKAPMSSDEGGLCASAIRHSSLDIRHSPPELSGSHCALFLQLRTLRI